MLPKYLKVPVEFAQLILSTKKSSEASVYLFLLFNYPGKIKLTEGYVNTLCNELSLSKATIYKKLKKLVNKDWIGKDMRNGWLFVRGLDYICRLEKWKYKRAVIMYPRDLKHIKAFLTGAVFLSLVVSGNQVAKTGRKLRRPKQLCGPVSLTAFMKILSVSKSTAQRYRNAAIKYGYIKSDENLSLVSGFSHLDLDLLRKTDLETVNIKLFGDGMFLKPVSISTLVKGAEGNVYFQRPNLITPKINYKHR